MVTDGPAHSEFEVATITDRHVMFPGVVTAEGFSEAVDVMVHVECLGAVGPGG